MRRQQKAVMNEAVRSLAPKKRAPSKRRKTVSR